jgi:hypothetical protein
MPIRAVSDLPDVADELPRIVTASLVPDLSLWYAAYPTVTAREVIDLLARYDATPSSSH